MKPVYCDESVWIPVANGLRQRGWKVHTASEEDTLGAPDRDQLRRAVENDWILLTFDDDFLSLVEKEGLEHPGIIYVNQVGKQIGEVVKEVDKLLQNHSQTSDIHYL
ncbi:MAG: DUF5615 family PIN-like protein [Candidatus Nanosalina sp.]